MISLIANCCLPESRLENEKAGRSRRLSHQEDFRNEDVLSNVLQRSSKSDPRVALPAMESQGKANGISEKETAIDE